MIITFSLYIKLAHNLYIIQELYTTAMQVYDQKSTKIERKNPGKDPPAIVFFCSGRTLILGAYWVVKPLKCVFYYLKGRGPLKNSKKFAEM